MLHTFGFSLKSFKQKDDMIRIEKFTLPHKFSFENEESIILAAESPAGRQPLVVKPFWELPELQSPGAQGYAPFQDSYPDQCRGIKAGFSSHLGTALKAHSIFRNHHSAG